MSKIIGIDLGTTNTCAAYLKNNIPKIITNLNAQRTTPSIVSYYNKNILLGENAKNKNAKNTIFAVKRLIGKKYDDIKDYVKNLPYNTFPYKNGDVWIKLENKKISPVQVSAEILKNVKEFSEKFLNEKVKKAIITVPAYFNDSQRQATKDAGKIAGLNVLRVINEPTAAALAYGLDKSPDSIIAVYDLGGGTFDISILEIKNGVFEVLSTNGNVSLGGEDIDNEIKDQIASRFERENNVKLNADDLHKIKKEVEKLKIELTNADEAQISIPNIFQKNEKQLDLLYTYTRKEIEDIVRHIINKTIEPCKQAIKDAKICKKDIKHVILVGGATRMPLVRQTAKEIFNKEPEMGVNPDEVVAKGAAIQGGILKGEVNDIVLLDVSSLSLGIETIGGLFSRIIKRNTTLPTKQTQTFTTSEDYQTEVEIKIYQGERPLVKHNKYLGELILKDIKPMKKGIPRIDVTFESNADGICKITARDALMNKEQSMEIKPASGLSEEEIEEIIEEAKEKEKEDHEVLKCLELKNDILKLKEKGINNIELDKLIENDIFDYNKANELLQRILK